MLLEIDEKVKELRTLMLDKFPGAPTTTFINIWDDGDWCVEIRFGKDKEFGKFTLYVYSYQKFENKNKFKESEESIFSDNKRDQFGLDNISKNGNFRDTI